MKKRLTKVLITVSFFVFCFATFAYASSSTVIFNGSGGKISITTSAPGVRSDYFIVISGGEFGAKQTLSTSHSTSIIREGNFSGGGSITAITDTGDPQTEFGIYLESDKSGYLIESFHHGSSVKFAAEAQSKGKGYLEVMCASLEILDFEFGLHFDSCRMGVLANAKPFDLSWVTYFDHSAKMSGVAQTE
ncbi:MAG: hypothetical protein U9R03_02255 [Candidatus Aerophobetes bacterium]|nr:hypothetical protein [Candidatus Aerophobetes bacterium]